MTCRRVVPLLLAAVLAASPTRPAQARGATGEEDALRSLQARGAPLALSANGQWRLHVDARNVLHRVNIADPRQVQQIQLPLAAYRIAASRSGRRVAVTFDTACVGLVDFGASLASGPTLAWVPGGPLHPPNLLRQVDRPAVPGEGDCARFSLDGSVVALSADGRLLATAMQVIDVDDRKVVAQLPFSSNDIGGRHPLLLQFVDNDSRLLMATATLGEGYESPSSPSLLHLAVWDLKSTSLHDLVSVGGYPLFLPQSLFAQYAAGAGTLHWIDANRYHRARTEGAEPDPAEPTLQLMQRALGGCVARAVPRFLLTAWGWESLLVDPLARWIAGVREAGGTDAKPGEELVVFDIESRRQVGRFPLDQGLRGLVATPDGARIFGLTSPGPTGAVVPEFKVDLTRVGKPQTPPVTANLTPCTIEDETPQARSVVHGVHRLRPLWTLPVQALSERRQQAREALTGRVDPAQSASDAACAEDGGPGGSFVMKDRSLWLDRFHEIAQLDPASGRTIRTLPTPRSDTLCSVPVPAAGGYINYQGDTLSWRPFDGARAGGPARRIIDVRPGWRVAAVRATTRSIVVNWLAKAGATPPANAQGAVLNMAIVTYDAATGARRHEDRWVDEAEYGMVGDDSEARELPACHDSAGAMTSGFDWRLSHFDSFRAYACGPTPADTKTVFWSHLDIDPRHAPPAVDGAELRQAWALDGVIAVAQIGNTLRLFDIATRRELAQVELASPAATLAVQVIESKGLLLVESMDADAVDGSPVNSRHLRAYSFGELLGRSP